MLLWWRHQFVVSDFVSTSPMFKVTSLITDGSLSTPPQYGSHRMLSTWTDRVDRHLTFQRHYTYSGLCVIFPKCRRTHKSNRLESFRTNPQKYSNIRELCTMGFYIIFIKNANVTFVGNVIGCSRWSVPACWELVWILKIYGLLGLITNMYILLTRRQLLFWNWN